MTYSRSGDIVTLDFRLDEYRALLAVLHFAHLLARDHAINPEIASMIADFQSRLERATGGELALFALLPEEP